MARFTRRAILLGSGAALGVAGARYFQSANPGFDGTTSLMPSGGPGTLNDASGLSETPIHKHIVMRQDPGAEFVDVIRAEIRDAEADGRPFSIGAARHSMGGQAIPRDGHAVTFETGFIEPDTATRSFRAHAGLRWDAVIKALDPLGMSPKVMQSNNDFGIAATFSVNAHGWPVKLGPMGATVTSLRMVLPDGDLVRCSRNENSELFNAAMGGYGLIGAIIEMEVEAADNLRLEPHFEQFPAEEYGTRFVEAVNDRAVNMAYGRLNVDRAHFFREALMITYRPVANQSDLPAASGSGFMSDAAARVYRWQLGNERMKRFRWWNETVVGPSLGGGEVTRNSLINEPVVTLDDRDPQRTDILHEYFVSPDRFPDFLTACREVIPASYQEFLNVTLRFIDSDPDSMLAYASVPRIAAVMSFSQEMTRRGEADMARMTEELIERIIDIGGTYYLPYRPHARLDQLTRAYPRAREFAALKRRIDPALTFRNNLWDSYLEAL